MPKKTLLFIFGTRPEFIKMLPLIEAARLRPEFKVLACSTGQHKEMLEALYSFFDFRPDIDFQLMRPDQNLVSLHAEVMRKVAGVIASHRPEWVVVQGDTTSAHAAAMAAFYSKVKVAHVEAGLRTYDIHSPFPEEMNRRAIGLVAALHLCPTFDASLNLQGEGTDFSSRTEVTGNTGIDTLNIAAARIDRNPDLRASLEEQFAFLGDEKFILCTMHRRENFGWAQIETLKALLEIVKSRGVNVLFPVHPNPHVLAAVNEVYGGEFGQTVFRAGEKVPEQKHGAIFLTNPLDYPAMIFVMRKCAFLMTDSGGLQEEAPSFGKKILVMRASTERPEGVEAGFAKLVGSNYNVIVAEAQFLLDHPDHWQGRVPVNPYGDGHAAGRILNLMTDQGLVPHAGDHASPKLKKSESL